MGAAQSWPPRPRRSCWRSPRSPRLLSTRHLRQRRRHPRRARPSCWIGLRVRKPCQSDRPIPNGTSQAGHGRRDGRQAYAARLRAFGEEGVGGNGAAP
eukprot:scaffold71750_cov30-Tisochrysis_lutea.AAC.5